MITGDDGSTQYPRDLAIGWVILATLKAKSKIEWSQIECAAAGQLKLLFSLGEESKSPSDLIQSSPISDDQPRNAIDWSLPECPVGVPIDPIEPQKLHIVLAVLTALEAGEAVDDSDADELLRVLNRYVGDFCFVS